MTTISSSPPPSGTNGINGTNIPRSITPSRVIAKTPPNEVFDNIVLRPLTERSHGQVKGRNGKGYLDVEYILLSTETEKELGIRVLRGETPGGTSVWYVQFPGCAPVVLRRPSSGEVLTTGDDRNGWTLAEGVFAAAIQDAWLQSFPRESRLNAGRGLSSLFDNRSFELDRYIYIYSPGYGGDG